MKTSVWVRGLIYNEFELKHQQEAIDHDHKIIYDNANTLTVLIHRVEQLEFKNKS